MAHTTTSAKGLSRGRAALMLLIVALVGVLGVLIVGIVGSLPGRVGTTTSTPQTRIEWEPPVARLSLATAQARAADRAREWSGDVSLIRAEGSWLVDVQAESGGEDLPIAWSFYYYSPSQRRLVVITVLDERLTWVPPLSLSYTPTSLSTFPPVVTPAMAWESFRKGPGGEYLVGRNRAVVDIKLMIFDGRPAWRLSAADNDGYIRVTLDAATGEEILVEQK